MTIKDQIPLDKKEWYAVKCKYRCEKRLMQEFLALDIETYVPIQKKLKLYTSGKKRVESVLISSHIFVRIDRASYMDVLQHIHVYGFLHFSNHLIAIKEYEIDIMKRVVGESSDIRIDSTDYNIGDEVQVIGGELTGLTGQLVDQTNHNFKISLSSLGMGLLIYVDPKHLTKLRSKNMVA